MRVVCLHSDSPVVTHLASVLLAQQLAYNATTAGQQPLPAILEFHCVTQLFASDSGIEDLLSICRDNSGTSLCFILDGSFSATLVRAMARSCGGIHWYLDYFLRPDDRYPLLGREGFDGAGISENCMRLELAAARHAWFATERGAIAAAADLVLDAESLSVLPMPIEVVEFSQREVDYAERLRKPIGNRNDGAPRLTLRVALCCLPTIEFRVLPLLRAAGTANIALQLIWMSETDEREGIARLLRDFPEVSCQMVMGRSVTAWRNILREVNCAYHASESGYEEFFPYLLESLAGQVPAIASNYANVSSLPSEILWKISPGRSEFYDITEVLLVLSSDPQSVQAKSALGLKYILDIHNSREIFRDFVFGIVSKLMRCTQSQSAMRIDSLTTATQEISTGSEMLGGFKHSDLENGGLEFGGLEFFSGNDVALKISEMRRLAELIADSR